MEMVISSKEYAERVTDEIESDFCKDLYGIYLGLSERYGFDDVAYGTFVEEFYDGYAAMLRDEAVKMLEGVGMPLRSDGRDF